MRLQPIKTLLFKSAIAINCILALIFGYAVLIYGLASPEYRPGAKPSDIIVPLILLGIAILISIALPIWIRKKETKTNKKTIIATLLACLPIIGLSLLLLSDTIKSYQSNKKTEELLKAFEESENR
jgi:uncharacterized membrane protein